MTMVYPDAIASVLGSRPYVTDGTGKSRARVLIFDDYVLKVRPVDECAETDVSMLQWLQGKLPVPVIAAHEVQDGTDWLLMTRIKGKMLCDPDVMNHPVLLMDCMAEALHAMWEIPTVGCPHVWALEDELQAAERIIREGRFDPAGCEPETFGPGGFSGSEDLICWLRKNLPPIDAVLTHGDFCLPNLFTDGTRLSGMIDLGDSGIADRWMDLALAWRSISHNSNGFYGHVYPHINPDDLFRAAGIPKDEEKLRYYILLDDLF